MKKRGFTLVEVIAVIIILVILLSVSIPNIIMSVGKQKDQELEKYYSTIKNSAELYVQEYRDEKYEENSLGLNYPGFHVFVSIEDMIAKKFLDPDLENPKTKNSVTEDATDNNDKKYVKILVNPDLTFEYIYPQDEEPDDIPKIILSNPISKVEADIHTPNPDFAEQPRIQDKTGNEIAGIQINRDSKVDYTKLGKYNVSYYVTVDENISVTKQIRRLNKTITVRDTTKPVITLTANPVEVQNITELANLNPQSYIGTIWDNYETEEYLRGRVNILNECLNFSTSFGSCQIKYSVSVSSGNKAVEKVLNVNVLKNIHLTFAVNSKAETELTSTVINNLTTSLKNQIPSLRISTSTVPTTKENTNTDFKARYETFLSYGGAYNPSRWHMFGAVGDNIIMYYDGNSQGNKYDFNFPEVRLYNVYTGNIISYNIGSKNYTDLLEAVDLVSDLTGVDIRLDVQNKYIYMYCMEDYTCDKCSCKGGACWDTRYIDKYYLKYRYNLNNNSISYITNGHYSKEIEYKQNRDIVTESQTSDYYTLESEYNSLSSSVKNDHQNPSEISYPKSTIKSAIVSYLRSIVDRNFLVYDYDEINVWTNESSEHGIFATIDKRNTGAYYGSMIWYKPSVAVVKETISESNGNPNSNTVDKYYIGLVKDNPMAFNNMYFDVSSTLNSNLGGFTKLIYASETQDVLYNGSLTSPYLLFSGRLGTPNATLSYSNYTNISNVINNIKNRILSDN